MRVNAAETGLEFGVPGAGVVTPLISYPSKWEKIDPSNPLEWIYHYSGFAICDGRQPILTSFNQPTQGWETDATIGRQTAFVTMDSSAEDGFQAAIDMHCAIPPGFTGWGPIGLRWRTRVIGPLLFGDTAQPTLTVYNPVTGALGPSASRLVAAAPEAGYGAVAVSQAQLNALNFQPGDLFRVRLGLVHNFVNGVGPTQNCGQLYVDWQ